MAGWYSRFIPNFFQYTVSLTRITLKDVRWQWNEEEQETFARLKLALTESPVLARPDFSPPFTLQTDTSDFPIAVVPTQEFY